MKKPSFFHVKKRTLLAVAGCVWMIAGFNVARLGVLSYFVIESQWYLYLSSMVVFILYGILTLTLCGGDAFHLIPRVIRAIKESNDKIKKQLGVGLQISSITMTVFYIILLYIWKYTFYRDGSTCYVRNHYLGFCNY